MRTGTPGFVAGRLTEAREARGLTQTSLSEATGIKSQSISHYEQGRQSPSPEALALLCGALSLPERFFLRNPPRFSSKGAFFRHPLAAARVPARQARLRAESRLGWLKEIALYVGKLVALPEVALPAFPLAPDAALDDVEQLAVEFRRLLGLGTGPLANVIQFLEARGCIVSRCPMEPDLEGSCSLFEAGIPYVLLGSDEPRLSWLRYHAARELGHLVMHRHLDDFTIEDSDAHRHLETQADRFARALLLPAAVFPQEVWAPTIDALLTLKKHWRCPVSVMVSRCGELGLFDPDQVRRATVNLVRRGWKTSEPREEDAELENPRLLARSIRLLVDGGPRDRYAIVTELGLNAGDIEELAGLPRGFMSTAPEGEMAELHLRA